MHYLLLDGHPDEARLATTLLDRYAASVPPGSTLERIAVRDLGFDPNLRRGYAADQAWEANLTGVASALLACDHLVVAFPLWWGAEPMLLKGLLDRILLPGFAFRYHRANPFWDRLLEGRSADVIVTMDTPPWYLRAIYGDPVCRRWKHQVLGFCGFAPIRFFRFGPTRRGGAARRIDGWQGRMGEAARTAPSLRRGVKRPVGDGRAAFAEAVRERQS